MAHVSGVRGMIAFDVYRRCIGQLYLCPVRKDIY